MLPAVKRPQEPRITCVRFTTSLLTEGALGYGAGCSEGAVGKGSCEHREAELLPTNITSCLQPKPAVGQKSWQLACPTEMDMSLEAFAAPEPKSLTLSWSYVLAFHCKN